MSVIKKAAVILLLLTAGYLGLLQVEDSVPVVVAEQNRLPGKDLLSQAIENRPHNVPLSLEARIRHKGRVYQ